MANVAPQPLALGIFGFACLVEFAQYFKIADILQLTGWARTIVGTSFSGYDILMYGLGCLCIYALDGYFALTQHTKRRILQLKH